MITVLLVISFLLMSSDTLADSASIRVGYVDVGQPYNVKQDNRLVAGINFDVIGLITEVSRYDSVEMIGLPKLRVSEFLRSGKVQMVCLYSPMWMKKPDEVIWGPPIVAFQEYFIVPKGSEPLRSHEQLAGKVVGGQLGYRYSEAFTDLVKQGAVRRDDFTNTDKMYELLMLNRLGALIDNQFSFVALRNKIPGGNRLEMSKLIDGTYETSCALSPHKPDVSSHLLAVMKALKKDHRFKRIVEKNLKITRPQ
ncbi:MAG: transporter substrate-binding domain-containing protein [Pseudomonadales bacterium]|nr:transporter substrate-binding domain-containing protein [Pseudomonadales bacterium]